MNQLQLDLPWKPSSAFQAVDPQERPTVVTLALRVKIGQTDYVYAQKKDMGWSAMPGAWTLFGGQVEEDDKDSEAAILREAIEELGAEFINSLISMGSKIVPMCDVMSDFLTRDPVLFRMYLLNAGSYSYSDWLEFQRKISLNEGVGCAAYTLEDMVGMQSFFVPHDRDMLGYALTRDLEA